MKQLTLDFSLDAPPTLKNFVVGNNTALLSALEQQALGKAVPLPSTRLIYIWGSASSGRTHLLQASTVYAEANGRQASYLKASEINDALPEDENRLIAIDDIETLGKQAQITLFNTFNRALRLQQALLLSGSCAPRELALREDLRTRIGQMLVFEVQPLDDTTRAAILNTLATRRGLPLAEDVQRFLLRHGRRDLPSLLATFNALDTASLEHKRPITLALLRAMQQQGLVI